ncbi:putative inactive shikimate kinase like 1, chloroplastic [Iris pallida]|uniref:Inactive shikimate kinase like 1, chloroplastic n=1 Tax=Iris pallida TaxID=29817 RepID=A0AAX6IJ13_IRIPA|nr:putative inactive shikimate kinase like 1, chloroplastic [Iris pallida]
MNCTMKTNLGKLLADSLRYYYFDSDSLVEQAAGGSSAANSLREGDEKAFRDSETEVLRQLSSMGRLLVCAGDGAVRSSTNLAFMRYGISIWIDIPLDVLANEVLKTEDLSNVAQATSDSNSFSKVLEEISQQYNALREGYETSDARVCLQKVASQLGHEELDCVTPEDMAVEVLKEIEKLTRVKKMMEAAARPF